MHIFTILVKNAPGDKITVYLYGVVVVKYFVSITRHSVHQKRLLPTL